MQTPIGRRLDQPDELFNWLHGVIVGVPVLHLACRSGLAARLGEGPATLEELSGVTGIATAQLSRLVDYLVAHEIAQYGDDGRVAALGERIAQVAADAGLWQQMVNTQWAGSGLTEALRKGTTAFEEKFGTPVFSYFADRPDAGALFGEFMSFMTRRTVDFVLANHRFAPFDTVVDIGGSHGTLLLRVLEAYPGTQGVLFDLPGVAAQARRSIAGTPFAGRVECVGGSFRDEVPSGDLYLLKQILHDWSDAECLEILGNVRAAIRPTGRVAVIDHLLSDTPRPSEAQSTDIAMMIWATGRERTRADFAGLFGASGFRLERVTENPSGHSVIEAVPA